MKNNRIFEKQTSNWRKNHLALWPSPQCNNWLLPSLLEQTNKKSEISFSEKNIGCAFEKKNCRWKMFQSVNNIVQMILIPFLILMFFALFPTKRVYSQNFPPLWCHETYNLAFDWLTNNNTIGTKLFLSLLKIETFLFAWACFDLLKTLLWCLSLCNGAF